MKTDGEKTYEFGQDERPEIRQVARREAYQHDPQTKIHLSFHPYQLPLPPTSQAGPTSAVIFGNTVGVLKISTNRS